MTIAATELRELLDHNPDTGVFVWRVSLSNKGPVGARAGSPTKSGHRYIGIRGEKYLEHRLAWLFVHGEFPSTGIDHRNLNPGDNRVSNLRLANQSQNIANTRIRSTNKSGYKGVCWSKWARKWHAQITVNYKRICLGFFDDPKDAHSAYLAAARQRFGEYARAR